jgi:HEPN domain-containing protein
LSGRYPSLLKKRALSAYKWASRAFEEGDYDTCVRELEYSVQLYVKSLIYRISGEEVYGHNIRELLGILASILVEKGFESEAKEIIEYIRRNRRALAELEIGHTRAVYGLIEYGRREAEILMSIASEILNLLKMIEERIFKE